MTATHTATGLETAMNVRSHGQEQQASPTGYEKQRPQWNQAGEGPVPGEEVGRADDAAGEDGQGEPEVRADAVHDGPFRADVTVGRRPLVGRERREPGDALHLLQAGVIVCQS